MDPTGNKNGTNGRKC